MEVRLHSVLLRRPLVSDGLLMRAEIDSPYRLLLLLWYPVVASVYRPVLYLQKTIGLPTIAWYMVSPSVAIP